MNRNRARRIAKLLLILGVPLMIIGLLGLSVPQASATAEPAAQPVQVAQTESSDNESEAPAYIEGAEAQSVEEDDCTTTTDGDVVRDECVAETVFGRSSFSLEGKGTAVATVKTRSGAKILLNIKVKPIKAPPSACWKVRPGTRVLMTGLWRGQQTAAPYTVKAGDNTFCRKHGKVVKKSCGNAAFGVPGGPKRPPRSMPRIRGKVVFADFYVYRVSNKVKESLSGAASAEVNVYDGDKKVCHASGTVTGDGFALSATTVRVRSRSMLKALAEGGRQITIQAQQNQNLHITARNMVMLRISGRVAVMCEYTPPPPGGDNKPPTCELVQFPEHVFVSRPGQAPNRYRFKVVWNDADEQLGQNDAVVTVTGQAFIVKGNPDFPERWDLEGTQWVYTGWIEAKQQTGDATFSVLVTDSEGATCQHSKTFPVVADQF